MWEEVPAKTARQPVSHKESVGVAAEVTGRRRLEGTIKNQAEGRRQTH